MKPRSLLPVHKVTSAAAVRARAYIGPVAGSPDPAWGWITLRYSGPPARVRRRRRPRARSNLTARILASSKPWMTRGVCRRLGSAGTTADRRRGLARRRGAPVTQNYQASTTVHSGRRGAGTRHGSVVPRAAPYRAPVCLRVSTSLTVRLEAPPAAPSSSPDPDVAEGGAFGANTAALAGAPVVSLPATPG